MDAIDGRWRIFTKDPGLLNAEASMLWEQGFATAPASYLGEDTTLFFPRKATENRCRVCGKVERLTKEHIPPKESGNKSNMEKHQMSDWLDSQDASQLNKGKISQGGIFGFTLCGSCNSLTGTRYGGEYQKWVGGANGVLSNLPLDEINTTSGPFAQGIQFGTKEKPVYPGALVRQVLSIMCSLSGSWNLTETYPAIKSIILNETLGLLPSGLDLGMTLYAGPRTRIAGPQFEVDLIEKSWRWIMEMAFPPFAFTLVLASSEKEPLKGIVMNDWTTKNAKEPVIYVGEIGLGFGWSPYPGDYRTLAQINKESA